jgi:dipeptidyl aminopeptidase/acylaminoacyl peptidase
MAIAAESGAPEAIFAPSPIIVAEQDCVAHFQARHHSTMPIDSQQRLEHMMLFNRFFFEFERSLQNLTCRQFRYRVGVVIVEAYVILPRMLPNTLLPVVICNRGGNNDRDSAITYASLIDWHIPLAKQGFIVVASQYRGVDLDGSTSPLPLWQDEFGGQDVNDIKGLWPVIEALRAADAGRVGMMGFSRGGMMAFLAAKDMPQLKALVIKAGTIDLIDQAKVRPEMDNDVFARMIPGYAIRKQQALAERTVHRWVAQLPATLPILLLHGERDNRVKSAYSVALAQRLTELNRPHKLVLYPGVGHDFGKYDEQSLTEAISWFKQFL